METYLVILLVRLTMTIMEFQELKNFFDKELRNKKLIDKPLELTLDTNIQFLIKNELDKALETFAATGGGALLNECRKWRNTVLSFFT